MCGVRSYVHLSVCKNKNSQKSCDLITSHTQFRFPLVMIEWTDGQDGWMEGRDGRQGRKAGTKPTLLLMMHAICHAWSALCSFFFVFFSEYGERVNVWSTEPEIQTKECC